MPADKNDELAKLLSGLADGHYEDPAHPHADHDHHDSIEKPPTPAKPAPKPASPQPAAPKAILPKTSMPKPATPQPNAAPRSPAPVAQIRRSTATPKPDPAPAKSTAPFAAPMPTAPEPEPQSEPLPPEDDDAVIVPAPPSSILGYRPKPTAPRRQHFVQGLMFKQTIIPISLSAGLICFMFITVGFLSNSESPFRAFVAQTWVTICFALIGLIMLAIGGVTMFMVKDQLARQPRQNS